MTTATADVTATADRQVWLPRSDPQRSDRRRLHPGTAPHSSWQIRTREFDQTRRAVPPRSPLQLVRLGQLGPGKFTW